MDGIPSSVYWKGDDVWNFFLFIQLQKSEGDGENLKEKKVKQMVRINEFTFLEYCNNMKRV